MSLREVTMTNSSYESITDVALGALEAMACGPRDNLICDRDQLFDVAVAVLCSWKKLVGDEARVADYAKMVSALRAVRMAIA
jgi:hypothetical protein